MTRGVDGLLADLAEAVDAAAELVDLGKERWDAERPLRLAGEAVIGRLGDVATKLPDEVIKASPEIPWREVKGMRIIAAHAYHRIDYETVWVTLRDDVPRIGEAIRRWRQSQA
ncbi:MAG TPA: HepT-like ribonuclease domain-containing protein [Streptosporangiaceae bacterium]|nr:HepT-like ribonuclease domain-containing protein [Streptosporangiaceae bacterium]